MRMRRIATAAVVLGLGIVGVALAQQADQRPGPQAATKATLRSRIIKLRAELEVLQLEHDVTRGELLDLMKGLRTFESPGYQTSQESVLLSLLPSEDIESLEKLVELAGKEGSQKFIEEQVKKKGLDRIRALTDPKKKDYARQAEELAGKRLDLEDLEKQYHDAR